MSEYLIKSYNQFIQIKWQLFSRISQPKKFHIHIDASEETETIYFSSGDHLSFLTESEWLEYLPMNFCLSTSNNRISAVSEPRATYLPLGETSIVISLYGYSILSTGSTISQSQNRIGQFAPHVTSSYSWSTLYDMSNI